MLILSRHSHGLLIIALFSVACLPGPQFENPYSLFIFLGCLTSVLHPNLLFQRVCFINGRSCSGLDSNAHNSSRDDDDDAAAAARNASHATLCVLEKNGRWRPQTIRENSAKKSPCTTRSRRRRPRRLRRS